MVKGRGMGAFGMHGRPHPELPLVPARLRRAAACAEHMVYTWCTHGGADPGPGGVRPRRSGQPGMGSEAWHGAAAL